MATLTKEKIILRAAEKLFTTRRFHEVTMDDVCQAAGVGKGTIYRYFKDKDELFQCIVADGMEELGAAVRTRTDSPLSFEEQLRQIVAQIRCTMHRRRQIFRLLHTEEVRRTTSGSNAHAQWMELRRTLVDAVTDILRRGAETGAVRKDIPPAVIASALLGMMRGFFWQTDSDAEDANQQIVDLFLRGAALSSTDRSELHP